MNNIITFGLMAIGAILIILILLQQKGSALGSVFGQESGFYGTVRGAEKKIFWLTCFFGALFIALALLSHISY
jgi:protein translocase SecG subunit